MQNLSQRNQIGIDDMAVYIPKLCLDIQELAQARGLDYEKLHKGLGLTSLAVPDFYEDAATMAADAVIALIDKNHLQPQQIGRIYLGTESSLDGSKPTASYIIEMLRERYQGRYGSDAFNHCDVVDMTFACIAGVDALQNTLDWVANGLNRIGIVVCSDHAKYEIGSGGEYTQGAGAIAMLIKAQPRLMVIHDLWGISTRSLHDFFKPIRTLSKRALVEEVLEAAGMKEKNSDEILNNLNQENHNRNRSILHSRDVNISLFKETPVFDGQFSNQCYQDRIREAFENFRHQAIEIKRYSPKKSQPLSASWERIIFHLPYAFQGKRMFPEIFAMERREEKEWQALEKDLGLQFPLSENYASEREYQKAKEEYFKSISRTEVYRQFIQEKTERSQRASSLVGNIYTGSLFLALMSSLEADLQEGNELQDKRIGFFSYGSGSKSKVFEGKIQKEWRQVVSKFHLFERLQQRKAIDCETYEQLHTGKLSRSTQDPDHEFALVRVGEEGVHEGARYYQWIE